ncbi:MAG: nucleotidyltransferase family protein [Nanoarchaeota archaeon]
MKIIIPIAGEGSRMYPHTHSTQKGLMQIAGRPILDYVIDDIEKINPSDLYFVVGHKKDDVKKHIETNYPTLNCHFVHQKIRDGDGGAVKLALEQFNKDDEIYIVFGADTLIDFNLKKSLDKYKSSDAIIFGMQVNNPSSYGVLNYDKNMNITAVEEKPENPKSDVAIIGAYYFKSAFVVREYLREFYKNNITSKGEYRIIQVIDKYTQKDDLTIKLSKVDKWFDCGQVSVMLNANKYFLEKKSKQKIPFLKEHNVIIPPVFISKSAKLKGCKIGPYVSIGPETNLEDVNIQNSIIDTKVELKNKILKDSLCSQYSRAIGKKEKLNLGANSNLESL